MSTSNLSAQQAAQADFPYGADPDQDDPFGDDYDPFAVHEAKEVAPHAQEQPQQEQPQQEQPQQEQPQQEQPQQEQPAEQSFFQKAARFMEKKGCNLNMMLTSNGDGRVRLTVTGQRVASADDDEKTPTGPPFQPFTVLDTPMELDAADGGLASFLDALVSQELSLQQLRARAEEAHKKAEKAEKRREKEAKERQKQASPGGPLFSGDS
jgi:PRTRC genetic system protein E